MVRVKDSFRRSASRLSWRVRTRLLISAIVLVILVLLFTLTSGVLNQTQDDGTLLLDILDAPVSVIRDRQGMPYLRAQNKRDLLRAQGFVIAQDRLFQLEMYRAQIHGRLSRYLGEKTIGMDTRMRVLGLTRAAEAHARVLSDSSRQYLQDYLDGMNAYITARADTHPVELKLVGIAPIPWTLTDAMAVLYFVNFETGANLRSELIAQALIDRLGPQRASELFPINVNPRRSEPEKAARINGRTGPRTAHAGTRFDPLAVGPRTRYATSLFPLGLGSNAWAVSPRRSATGAAVLANDPHLDATILPGIWYPIGLSTPDFRAVGGALPGLPGLLIGRSDHLAFSMTNGYGDTQDLYIERPDPDKPGHYREGERSVPFESRVERITVKDAPDVEVTIRSTSRGPVLSDHAVFGYAGAEGAEPAIITHRWSVREKQLPDLSFDRLMWSRTAAHADQAIRNTTLLTSNIVFADSTGNIGIRSSGLIPIRRNRNGSHPQTVSDGHESGDDHWTGFIAPDDMPGEMNPPRGWVASANHDVRPDNYPYYYSSYFAASYRISRVAQLLDSKPVFAAADHATFQLDTLNLHANRQVPLLVKLLREGGHKGLAHDLDNWDRHDRADSEGALIFHLLYRLLALEILTDELGDALAEQFFAERYFWLERLDKMLAEQHGPWFDDIRTTDTVETLADLVSRAALVVEQTLQARDAGERRWGDEHRVRFVSPLRLSGTGSGLLGGGDHPMPGSNETLLRSTYTMDDMTRTRSIDSARIVMDLADTNSMRGVVSGGHAARQFHSRQKTYLEQWLGGGLSKWWLGAPPPGEQVTDLTLAPKK